MIAARARRCVDVPPFIRSADFTRSRPARFVSRVFSAPLCAGVIADCVRRRLDASSCIRDATCTRCCFGRNAVCTRCSRRLCHCALSALLFAGVIAVRTRHRLHESSTFPKRGIPPLITRFFDPSGLIAPAIVGAKHMLQRTWQATCDWDGLMPPDTHAEWASCVSAFRKFWSFAFRDFTILLGAPHVSYSGFVTHRYGGMQL